MDRLARLPTMAVPLRPPHKDVPLDLQAVVDDVYRRARYAESLDYTGALPAPRPVRRMPNGPANRYTVGWRPG